jgi:cell division septation protein DedD
MNSLIDSDNDFDREENGDRELTLSTGAILGLFLGLVLLCGAFFGFGYKMGSHKPAPILAAEPATSPADFSGFQPSGASNSTPKPTAGSSSTPAVITPTQASVTDEPVDGEPGSKHTTPLNSPPPPPPTHAAAPPAARTAEPAAVESGVSAPPTGFVVQIAAISPIHQGDAELLVSALKTKGYPAAARTEPQDKLLHIQVGPYASRQAAEAAKQRLSADGYNNPIVK